MITTKLNKWQKYSRCNLFYLFADCALSKGMFQVFRVGIYNLLRGWVSTLV